MKPRLAFPLRDVFWLTLVVAIGMGWWVEHRNSARREVTFEIRDPRNHARPVLVRLNVDRLIANDLSKSDVMRAVRPRDLFRSGYPPEPPGVVYTNRSWKLGDLGSILLKANSAGELVRLQDIGQVEFLTSK